MKRSLVVTLRFGLLILVASGASAAPTIAAVLAGYVPGQVLVELEERTPRSVVEEGLRVNGTRPVERVHALDVLVLDVPRGREEEVVSALSKNPNVQYAEPNYLRSAASASHLHSHQWNL